jgi:hypothetical protein
MATKKKAAKKTASKKVASKKAAPSKAVEILIGTDGSVPDATHISIARNGAAYWKSADKKKQWEIYFLNDPFDGAILTGATGKTRKLRLHKRVSVGDQYIYHIEGPRHLRKGQVKISNSAALIVEA